MAFQIVAKLYTSSTPEKYLAKEKNFLKFVHLHCYFATDGDMDSQFLTFLWLRKKKKISASFTNFKIKTKNHTFLSVIVLTK